jgi:hypothetical protein
MLEILNTSANATQLGKNTKVGNWESLELHGDEADDADVRANHKSNQVYSVRETVRKPHPLNKVIKGKLEHLVKTEKEKCWGQFK